MTGKGTFTQAPKRRLRLLIAIYGLWLFTVLLLTTWWASLLLSQAERIADLEMNAGLSSTEALSNWERTQRMLYWETSAFVFFLVLSSALLILFYYRD